MTRMMTRFAAAFVLFVSFGSESAAQDLAQSIERFINAPVYRHSLWGILVSDLKTGERLFRLNDEKLMRPASVTKLFSVAAAFETLGSDYRFKTPIHRTAAVMSDGTLKGDLILVASGDPTLGGRSKSADSIAFRNVDHIYAGFTQGADVTDTDQLAGLTRLAKQVADSGIRRVEGDVLIDDRLFEHAEGTGSGPSRLTPIVINDNVIDVVVTPDAEGKPAKVRYVPNAAAVKVESEVITGAGGGPSFVTLTLDKDLLRIRGQIAAGASPIVRFREVEDPAAFARTLFIESLAKHGVNVSASASHRKLPLKLPSPEEIAKMPKVAELVSSRFSESAKLILKVSHNLHAGLLPLIVGARDGGRSLNEGIRVQGQALRRLGLNMEGLSFGSAAGGSPSDFASPESTVDLLRRVNERPYASAFEAALPILGIDGTLWDVVPQGSSVIGKVRAKTGTYVVGDPFNDRFLLTSKALAGYMETKSGRKLAFAIYVNNVPQVPADTMPIATTHGRALGRLCEIIHDAL